MTQESNSPSLMAQFSEDLANAVEQAGRSVYTVHGGRRAPGTGIAWPGGYVVTADHILHPDVFFYRSAQPPRRPPGGGRRFTIKLPEPEKPEEPEQFTVTRPDGQNETATLVGHDAATDIAVLKLAHGPTAPAAEFAPSGSLRPGNLVLALGRAGGTGVSSSFGAVTAIGDRWWTGRGGVIEWYIRASVTMYPGFSGCPLVDVHGRVVGLNSSLLGRGEHLAIPVTSVDAIVKKLVTGEQVKRAYLGISSQPTHVPPAVLEKAGLQSQGALMIMWVEPGSPAEQGGLIMGDLLVAIDGRPVSNPRDLLETLTPDRVGKPVPMLVLRGGARREVTVTPGERE
jgi:S1-C subfamily serine protease